jgi:AP-3 complex subunit mu
MCVGCTYPAALDTPKERERGAMGGGLPSPPRPAPRNSLHEHAPSTMIQSLFILSPTGEVLVERHFRSILTSRTMCDIFWTRASESLNHHGGVSTVGSNPFPLYDSVPPVMEVPDVTTDGGANAGSGGTLYLFHVLRHGLTYLAACPPCIGGGHFEVPPLLVIEFLHKIADTFVLYFGDPADESAVKDNFSTAYQLLEEMVDHGWPLTTEPNALTDLIRPPTVLAKVIMLFLSTIMSCHSSFV